MAVDYSPDGRIGKLIVRGAKLRADAAAAVLSGTLTLDYEGVTELALTVADPDLELTSSRLLGKGSTIDYLGLRLVVASNELSDASGGPQVAVTARAAGVRRLRGDKGAHVWRGLTPTQVAASVAKKAGVKFVGQASSKRRQIRRGKKESSWGLITRLAKELGYVSFEAEGTVYFGKPTWLLAQAKTVRRVSWSPGDDQGSGGLAGFPGCRWAEDSKKNAAEVTLELVGDDADSWRPGDAVILDGVATFSGRYLVTKVTIPLDDTSNVEVTASTPVDPKPEPPAKKASSKTGAAAGAAGSGGVTSNTVAKIVASALGQVGDAYVYGAETSPSDPNPDAFDCSELIQWACERNGVNMVDGSSAQLAYCRAHGTVISVEQAINTRGALLFANGHVALSLGNGRTVEALNRSYGVTTMNARGRVTVTWVAGALIPGVKYHS